MFNRWAGNSQEFASKNERIWGQLSWGPRKGTQAGTQEFRALQSKITEGFARGSSKSTGKITNPILSFLKVYLEKPMLVHHEVWIHEVEFSLFKESIGKRASNWTCTSIYKNCLFHEQTKLVWYIFSLYLALGLHICPCQLSLCCTVVWWLHFNLFPF